eukprot:scaffold131187_cov48-Phaeocystis_antarctica.AAC.1
MRPAGVLAAYFFPLPTSYYLLSEAHRRAKGERVHVLGGRGVDLACHAQRGAVSISRPCLPCRARRSSPQPRTARGPQGSRAAAAAPARRRSSGG